MRASVLALAGALFCLAGMTGSAFAQDMTLVDRPLREALAKEPYKSTWARVTADVEPKFDWVKAPAPSGASQWVTLGTKKPYLVAFGEQPKKKSVDVMILFGDEGKTAVALITDGKKLQKFIGAPPTEEREFLIESSGPD